MNAFHPKEHDPAEKPSRSQVLQYAVAGVFFVIIMAVAVRLSLLSQ